MASTAPPLIPADVRSRLRGLRLLPQRASGSRGIGLHASRSRGAGLEFAQYRAYEPGDELRQIDWKLYARSDRFFVRESERESPLTVWLLLDASASMAQADQARPEWRRLDAAKSLAACIADVVCGGEVEAGSLVSEEYLMALERKHFCALLDNPKTQERIMGMLQTGKPVRN